MSEEVTIGDCRLILGDCRDVLPTLPMVDLVLTDPPYGLGKRMQGGTWGGAQKYKDLVIWDSRPADDLLLVLATSATQKSAAPVTASAGLPGWQANGETE
jgi:DNA modification methylase